MGRRDMLVLGGRPWNHIPKDAYRLDAYWRYVTLSLDKLISDLSLLSAFGFYAGLNLVAFVMIFFLMP